MNIKRLIYIISLILLNFVFASNKIYAIEKSIIIEKNKTQNTKYVIATSGLIFRDKPKGNVLGKFNYGEKVQIIENTGILQIIHDNGKKISSEWVGITYRNKTVYCFGGYLVNKKQFTYIDSKYYKPLSENGENIKNRLRITPISKNTYTNLSSNNGKLPKNLKIDFITDDDDENPICIKSITHKKILYRLGSKPFISPKGNYFVSGEAGIIFSGIFELFEIDNSHNVSVVVSFEFEHWTLAKHLDKNDKKITPNKYDIKWINNKSFLLPIFQKSDYTKVKYLKIEIL